MMAQSNAETTLTTMPKAPTRAKALVLINRHARHGRDDIRPALSQLADGGIELIESPIDRPSDLTQTIRSCIDRVDLIIIGGGDGTLSQAADGLIEAGLPLVILPLGTANDLARTLGIPTDLRAAADVILQGHSKRIDLGWVNGTHFFNVASIGLTTGLTRRLSRQTKSRWGILAYAFAAIGVGFRARPFTAEIRTENETVQVRTIQIAVGNGRHYGGGMIVDENARIDDGQLHLVSLEVDNWRQLVPLIPALRTGTFAATTRVRTLQGREFEIHISKKKRKKVLADGELTTRTPARFRVVPGALEVFVPSPTAESGITAAS